ncbi:GNAT family N-acetyltransferase [Streptomyces sp. NPDC060275]|uniref:GNAT family N-acetyltransferase n=1 Tax=Streptomyces sp. NPDC060275 TaxID=3347090 RepID=UPI0036633BE0
MVRIESRRTDNAEIVRLAAVRDCRVVGTTVVITAHSVAGIFLVHVAEEHRRRGVGSALTAAAPRVGRRRGMRSAVLVAGPAGEPLYGRFGFAAAYTCRHFDLPAQPRAGARLPGPHADAAPPRAGRRLLRWSRGVRDGSVSAAG